MEFPSTEQMIADLDKAGYKTPDGMPSLRELHEVVERLCSPAAEMARAASNFVDNGDGTFSIRRPNRFSNATELHLDSKG